MHTIYRQYEAINNAMTGMMGELPALSEPPADFDGKRIRLREKVFAVSGNLSEHRGLITAHRLGQYKKKYFSLMLRERSENRLEYLLRAGTDWN